MSAQLSNCAHADGRMRETAKLYQVRFREEACLIMIANGLCWFWLEYSELFRNCNCMRRCRARSIDGDWGSFSEGFIRHSRRGTVDKHSGLRVYKFGQNDVQEQNMLRAMLSAYRRPASIPFFQLKQSFRAESIKLFVVACNEAE